MNLRAAGLTEQPFRIHGKPLAFLSYEAQQRAHEFLQQVRKHPTGLGLLQGPLLSGKTTLIHSFIESLGSDAEAVVVDGAGLDTTALLKAILEQFGYPLEFNSTNELLSMIKVYVLQRTATAQAPMLIIENTHAMNPSALQVLCELAKLRVKHQSALRLVLVSDRSIDTIINAPAMECMSSRLTGTFDLGPMTDYETTDYLHAKLKAGGCPDPERVIPQSVCAELHAAAGGWPGILDRVVLLALAKAPACPLSKHYIEHPVLPDSETLAIAGRSTNSESDKIEPTASPTLILTINGETIASVQMKQQRLIIGRAEHNDMQVDSKFISRSHAMLIRNGNSTFLMDLNSANGTFVNSRRISNRVLMHNDIISLGNHRIKFVHVASSEMTENGNAGLEDTIILKNLAGMRQLLAEENTELMTIPASLTATGDDHKA